MILKVRGVEVGSKNRSNIDQKSMLTCEGILASIFNILGVEVGSKNRSKIDPKMESKTGCIFWRSKNAPRRPKTSPRRPRDAPRCRKTLPRCPQDAPRRTQAAPRRPQDDPKRRPRRSQEAPKRRPRRTPRRSEAQSPPDLDFGAIWGGFWTVLGWIFEGFWG